MNGAFNECESDLKVLLTHESSLYSETMDTQYGTVCSEFVRLAPQAAVNKD